MRIVPASPVNKDCRFGKYLLAWSEPTPTRPIPSSAPALTSSLAFWRMTEGQEICHEDKSIRSRRPDSAAMAGGRRGSGDLARERANHRHSLEWPGSYSGFGRKSDHLRGDGRVDQP